MSALATAAAFVVATLALALLVAYLRWKRRSLPCDPTNLCVGFLHPDLGIGGAERFVVDAAVATQQRGHRVFIYTAHHESSRSFEETRDGTLRVVVAGACAPRNLRGRLHVACASLRSLGSALCLLLREPECEVVVVDQVAASVPLLRLLGIHVLFYCHFPDKLLAEASAATAAAAATAATAAAAAAAATAAPAATAAAATTAANPSGGRRGVDISLEISLDISLDLSLLWRLPLRVLRALQKQVPF